LYNFKLRLLVLSAAAHGQAMECPTDSLSHRISFCAVTSLFVFYRASHTHDQIPPVLHANTTTHPSSKRLMKYSAEHFKSYKALGKERFERVEPLLRQKVADGVNTAIEADDVRSVAPLQPPEVLFLSKDMPLVKQVSDLEKLASVLGKQREFGFSILFSPELVDHCCRLGIFPLALEVKRGVFVLAPKLHAHRALVRLVDEPMSPIPMLEDGEAVFDPRTCHAKGKVANKCEFYINRLQDVSEVFQLIHLQHGENWMCAPLRACIVHMLLRPELFETRIVVFAMRTKRSVDEAEVLVACEVGFIVGDVYTSATGAYGSSGCGTVQLAALGTWLRRIGVKVWDLGMLMEYKERCLGCVLLPRNKWLQLVEKRRAQLSDAARRGIAASLADQQPNPCIIDHPRPKEVPSVVAPASRNAPTPVKEVDDEENSLKRERSGCDVNVLS
jgi:hypothetical protein